MFLPAGTWKSRGLSDPSFYPERAVTSPALLECADRARVSRWAAPALAVGKLGTFGFPSCSISWWLLHATQAANPAVQGAGSKNGA